jgi:ankyrin repeat protein
MVTTGGGVPPYFSAVDYAKAVSEKCAAVSIKYLGDAESIINCIRADDARQLADVTTRADGKECGLMLLLACIHGALHCVLDLSEDGFAVPYVDVGLGDGIPGCSSLVDLASQFGHHHLTIPLECLDSVGGGTAFDVHSPLFEAAYQHPNGQLECLLRDEDTRRSVNTANSKGLIPLMVASASAVPVLVEAGADVNLVHGYTGTALYQACRFASLEKVKALVECGADENRAGPEGKTPLMVAIDKTRANIVEYLVGRPGIDIEAKAADGDRAINFACYKKPLGMVKLLVGAGAKVNAQPTDEGSPPLVSAVWGGDLQVVKYLVECGADVNVIYKSDGGNTPLMLAVRDGHIGIVEYLLGRPGIDIDAKSDEGERAIDIAYCEGHREVVKLLVAAGARVDAQDSDEEIGALAEAAVGGHLHVVKYPVEEAGADANRRGTDGVTPLMWARGTCLTDVANHLQTVESQREHEVSVPQLA